MEVTLKLDYKGCEAIVDEARKLNAENKELKAKLEAREKSIKNLSEWIIEMGTYADVDIQRDFSGYSMNILFKKLLLVLKTKFLVANLTLNDKIKLLKLRKR